MKCLFTSAAIGLVLGGLSTSARAVQLPMFPDALEFVHGSVTAMVAADLDQDGDEDLVIVTGGAWPSHLEEPGVLVRQNMGGGRFRTTRLRSLHEPPGGVAVADLDGDGRVEIVVTLPNSNQVTVLRRSAIGPFDEAVLLAAGTAARQITIADVNADGRLDLVVGRGWGGPLLVLPARQPGVFDPPYELFPGVAVDKFQCADLDRDGRMDVMISSESAVRISHGSGGGAFGAWVPIPLPWTVRDVRAIDLDGSGSLDLVVQTNAASVYFSVLATGPRAYGPPHLEHAHLTDFPLDTRYGTMAVGDADGDGDDDLFIVGGWGDASVIHNASGTLLEVSRPAPTIIPVTSVLAADFDGDGRADLAASGPTGEIDVSRSLPGGRLESAIAPHSAPALGACAQGDVDRDGRLDLVLKTPTGFDLRLGDGTGCFETQYQFDLPLATLDSLNGLALADLDADGDLDVTGVSWGRVYVSRGDGSGGFGVASVQHSFTGGGRVKSGDVNGDGFLDWILLDPWASAHIAIQFGDGQGGFHPQTAYPAPRRMFRMEVADFDEDGRDDLVGLVEFPYETDQVCVMYGHDRGAVGRRRFFRLGLDANSLVAGDFDGDGHKDLALAYAGDATLGIGTVFLRGNGQGELLPSPSLPPSELTSSHGAFAGDLSGDGRDDLVVVSRQQYLPGFDEQSNAFEVFLSGPSGSWTDRGRYLDTQFAGSTFFADVDQDGRTDLIRYGFGLRGNLAVHLQR